MTIGDLYKKIKEFYDICILPYVDDSEHYYRRFNDILVRGKHIRWIRILDWLKASHGDLADMIIEQVESSGSGKIMFALIVELMQEIMEFIDRHETCTDAAPNYINTRDQTAMEMRDAIEKTLKFIMSIYPDAYDFINKREVNDLSNEAVEKIHESFTTEKGIKLIESLVEAKLIKHDADKLEWKGTASLYGFFVDRTSVYLSMRRESERIPWKNFKTIFTNHETLCQTAKQVVNNYNNGSPKPTGYKCVIGLTGW